MWRSRSSDSITGRSHQRLVRWPNTTPMCRDVLRALRARARGRPRAPRRRRRHQDAGQHLERGRLAGAVRPQVADQLARRDVEADAVHRAHDVMLARDQVAQRAQPAAVMAVDAEFLAAGPSTWIMQLLHDSPCSDNGGRRRARTRSATPNVSGATNGARNGVHAGRPNGSGLPSRYSAG